MEQNKKVRRLYYTVVIGWKAYTVPSYLRRLSLFFNKKGVRLHSFQDGRSWHGSTALYVGTKTRVHYYLQTFTSLAKESGVTLVPKRVIGRDKFNKLKVAMVDYELGVNNLA